MGKVKLRNLNLEEKKQIIEKYNLEILDNIKINDNEVDVTCRICGEQCKRIYGRHLKHSHNNISAKEYRELFDSAPITSLTDKKTTSKNSGKHMKQEKYKKMFSEKIKGEKNPMHRSKTTDEFRKSISPFSIEFYNLRYPELTMEQRKEKLHKFAKEAVSERIGTTDIEYYLNQGLTEEEAKNALSERQTTFSKEICIEKYGEEKGLEIWDKRQEKWLSNLNKNGKLKLGYSGISQQLFHEIHNRMPNGNFLYAKNGGELKVKGNCNFKWYMYDFTDVTRNKIIEYNGDQYHANPSLFDENDHPHPFRKGFKSKDIWEKDRIKNKTVIDMGYDVLTIWESDYNNRIGISKREATIQKCIDFLLEQNEFSEKNNTKNDKG